MEFFIGTSGWNYRHWKGKFYPENLKQKEWFDFYRGKFDTVEINYSFYRWPSEKTMKKWFSDSQKRFIFTLKIPREITHVKRIKEVGAKIKDFYKLSDNLKNKNRAFLFQLPPSYRFNEKNLKRFKEFLKTLDTRRDNVIEFREKNWWNTKVYDLLKKEKVGFCVVDGLDMPDKFIITADFGYLRLHGNKYGGDYSENKLKKYLELIKKSKAKRFYVYFNNDQNAFAPKNALELKRLVEV